MAAYNALQVSELLQSLVVHPAVFRLQATKAIVDQFGCTLKTAAKWIDRTENAKLVRYKAGSWTAICPIEEEEKRIRREAAQAAGVIHIHSARVKRNRVKIQKALV